MKRKLLTWLLVVGFAQAAMAGDWQWEKTRVPMALVIKGIWWESFQVDQALDKAGYRQEYEIKDLSHYSVIVLANAPTSRFPKGLLDKLNDFVSHGGGLVVLGGLCAYDNGGYGESPLAEILPADLKQSYIEFYVTAEKGAKLTRAGKADWSMPYDFKSGPAAYYFHTLIPKSGATVQVNVGDQPALISGTFGKGRVVACALSVNGNPPPNAVAFWKWNDWPALLAQAVAWAGDARPAGVTIEPKTALQPLTVEELQAPALPKDFAKRAVAHPDEKIARLLFDLAVPETNKAKCNLDAVVTAILPYAKPEWGPRVKPLAAESNPNLEVRKAALTLLGACHEPSAASLLAKAFNDKKTELAAMDGFGWLGSADAIPVLKDRFEEALKPARVADGPDRWEPLVFADATPVAAHAALALYRLGDADAVARLSALFRNVNLYDRICWNASLRSTPSRVHAQLLDQVWELIMDNAAPIPATAGPAFVKYAATASDPAEVEFLADALDKSAGHLPKADWKNLASAKSGIIAKMSKAVSP